MADSRFPFIRFFTRGSGKPKQEGQQDANFRRTRSLCEGRAGIPANVRQLPFSHVGTAAKLHQSQRLSHKKNVPQPISSPIKVDPVPIKPMDFSTKSGSVPLPAEVVQLCESAFAKLYCPYEHVRWTLLEQIRRIFYQDCHGDLQSLCHNFLAPAANLLDSIKKSCKDTLDRTTGKASCLLNGWPLTVDSKVLIHLTEFDRHLEILRPGDFYFHISRPAVPSSPSVTSPNTGGVLFLCLKVRTLLGDLIEIRIPSTQHNMAFSNKWFEETIFHSSDTRLLGALQFCVVSFERSIDRIELQLLASGLRSVSAHAIPVKDANGQQAPGLLAVDHCKCLCSVQPVSKAETLDPPDPPPDVQIACLPLNTNHGCPFPMDNSQSHLGRNESSGRANLINELNQELMLSGGMTFPGILDRQQHPVVFIFAQRFPPAAREEDVVDLLGYFYSIARESVAKNGFTIVVDVSLTGSAADAQELFLKTLDGAVRKAEEKLPNGIHRLLINIQSETPIEAADQIRDSLVKSSSVKIIFIHGKDDLRMQIDDMSILHELGGRLTFNHQKFVAYRTMVEPFIETCRMASRRLLEAIQELKLLDNCMCRCRTLSSSASSTSSSSSRTDATNGGHIFTAAHYNVMIQAQKKMMQHILEDGHLLRLQVDGDAMLLRFQQEQSSREAKDSYDQAAQIYNEVHTASVKLAKLADKRLAKLEKCYQTKRFEEEARKVLSWICQKGEDSLQRHLIIGDNLNELRIQQREFDKFDFTASLQIEKGSDLLEEFDNLDPNDSPAVIAELCRVLRDRLKRFYERLDDIRERNDDAIRFYCLIERAFDWTLKTINFASQFHLEPDPTLVFLNEQLQKMANHARTHPKLSKENFNEMDQLAARLKIPKLSEQCAIARKRCREAESLSISKETAFLTAKCALVPVNFPDRSLELPAPPVLPVRRDLNHVVPYDISQYRNSTFRQASIPEMDESTSSLSEPPFIDAESTAGTDSVPQGSLSPTQEELPTEALTAVERRPRGNMKRSLTWQCGEGSNSRSSASEASTPVSQTINDGNYTEEDFSLAEKARVGRRESWTVPTSNAHLFSHMPSQACLPKDGRGGYGNDGETGYCNNTNLIVHELLKTEQDYILALRYVIDNYLPDIFKDSVPQMLRGKRNVVFGNLSKILEFHENDFLPAMENLENSPFRVGQVFRTFEKKFYLYALYSHNKPKSDELMAECGNEYFRAKQLQLMDKMDLSSYLLRPVQRMGKYALLLKQLLKACPRTDPEWADLQYAEEMVKFQLRHGNDLLAMDQLRDCDVNLKEQGRLLRQDDMMVWQAGKKKTIRRVFLFEEIILFSKVRRLKHGPEVFLYKTSLKTNDLGLTEQLSDSLVKFEIWFRKRKSGDNFILQAPNGDIKQAWTSDISKILWHQAHKSREARLVEMTCMGIGNKSCLDIKPSEDQIDHRFVEVRSLGCRTRDHSGQLFHGSNESLRNHHKNPRPHSIISVSTTSSIGSTLISSPVQSNGCLWNNSANTSSPDDSTESPRRSQCSSESGICTDMINSTSPMDSDSSK